MISSLTKIAAKYDTNVDDNDVPVRKSTFHESRQRAASGESLNRSATKKDKALEEGTFDERLGIRKLDPKLMSRKSIIVK